MKVQYWTVIAACLAQGCFKTYVATRNGATLSSDATMAEMRSCYDVAAQGVDFEHHWKEEHDGVVQRWIGCMKERGVRLHGGNTSIVMGHGTAADMARDDRACWGARSPNAGSGAGNSSSGIDTDVGCFRRKGYITISVPMLQQLAS